MHRTHVDAACCRRGLGPGMPCRVVPGCMDCAPVLPPTQPGQLPTAEAAWPVPSCPVSPQLGLALRTLRYEDRQWCTQTELCASLLNL